MKIVTHPAHGPMPECPRCGRGIDPWPLARGNRCSPSEWVRCIRNDEVAMALVYEVALKFGAPFNPHDTADDLALSLN